MLSVNERIKPAYTNVSISRGVEKQKDNEATLDYATKIEASNPDIAFSLYSSVAADGNAFAQYKCGVMLIEGTHPL